MFNKEDIIRMAQEADATGYGNELTGDAIERFASLVAAAERESWPAEMEAMERQVNILTDALAQAKAEERAACIEAVEKSRVIEFVIYPKDYLIRRNEVSRCYDFQHARSMEAIRARGETK